MYVSGVHITGSYRLELPQCSSTSYVYSCEYSNNVLSFFQQPQQLVEIITSSIIERSNKLLQLIAVIRTALFEIAKITSPSTNARHQISELHQSLPLALRNRHPAESSGSSTTADKRSFHPDYSNKSTPQRSGLHSVQHTSSAGTLVTSFTPIHEALGQLDPAVEAVMQYFSELIFEVVNRMVLSSHDQFISSLWSSAHSSQHSSSVLLEQHHEKSSRVVSFNVPDSPEKVESLAEVLKQDPKELQTRMGSLVEAFRTQ